MATRLPTLPYAHLNLRRNPFGQPPPEELPHLAVVDLPSTMAEVRSHLASETPLAVQLVGPPGCGKSTRLHYMAAQLPESARLAWTPEGWPPPPAGRLLLMDDAHMMAPGRLRRALRGRVAVVLATHVDLGGVLRAAGFVTRTISVEERITPERLHAILARRVEWARRGKGPTPGVGHDAARGLLARHRGDMRAMLTELYHWIQGLAGPTTFAEAGEP